MIMTLASERVERMMRSAEVPWEMEDPEAFLAWFQNRRRRGLVVQEQYPELMTSFALLGLQEEAMVLLRELRRGMGCPSRRWDILEPVADSSRRGARIVLRQRCLDCQELVEAEARYGRKNQLQRDSLYAAADVFNAHKTVSPDKAVLLVESAAAFLNDSGHLPREVLQEPLNMWWCALEAYVAHRVNDALGRNFDIPFYTWHGATTQWLEHQQERTGFNVVVYGRGCCMVYAHRESDGGIALDPHEWRAPVYDGTVFPRLPGVPTAEFLPEIFGT